MAEFYRRGKERRRARDLTAEKYAVHICGEGDGQWADIVGGSYVMPPPNVGRRLRLQENLLKPIVANMVKHHTAIPFRASVEAAGSRKARRRAKIDQAYANHVCATARLNEVYAEALWMGAPYGSCPVHFQWRDDLSADFYAPLYDAPDPQDAALGKAMRRGFVDCFAGDPWGTVYNDGATRSSIHRVCYERVLPLSLVRRSFGVAAAGVTGRKDLPSASRFQRMMRRAMDSTGGGTHGTAAMTAGQGGEELVALLCDELAPGLDDAYPQGRLTIIALTGTADTDQNRGGEAVLLHVGALPGGCLSVVPVYCSADGLDDVLGSPFVAGGLDDAQVELNQLKTLRAERIRRFSRPQLLAQHSGLEDDGLVTADDAILYYTGDRPAFLAPPQADTDLYAELQEVRDYMYRTGGWQAASRGEGKAGDSGSKVVMLANADDSIFADANQRLQNAVCAGLQVAHRLARQFMFVPTPLCVSSFDLAPSALDGITREDLSPEPPRFTLVQGSASPDARKQELFTLVQVKGADGLPLLTTEQYHEANPDASLRPAMSYVERARRIRPQIIVDAIEAAAEHFGAQFPMVPPEQAAQVIHAFIGQQFKPRDGDDPQRHIDALDELILDESADLLAREAAVLRRQVYAQWQAQLQGYAMMTSGAGQQQARPLGQPGQAPPAQLGSSSPFAGSPGSNELATAGGM